MADRALDGATSGPLNDELWGHRWGFRDTEFTMGQDGIVEVTGSRYSISGTRMPYFHEFAKEIFKMPNVLAKKLPPPAPAKVAPSQLTEQQLAQLQERFSAEQLSLDDLVRLVHSHGQTTADEVLLVTFGQLVRVADAVIFPQNDQDVADIIVLARKLDICLVPYGGGTSVSCALLLPQHETRPIISLDMKRMCAVELVDGENRRAVVQAGITGRQLEAELAKRGYTCGHEPDSMELSTLGGWIATNASGMKKNRYGNIEDLVEQVTLVTPEGVLATHSPHPRVATGPQADRLVFGSEGNLGVITRAVIRIFPLPEATQFGSIVFPDFQSGTAFLKELAQSGQLPASIRLVDNLQFRFSQALKPAASIWKKLQRHAERWVLQLMGYHPARLCAATVLMEGNQADVKRQCKEIVRIAKRHGGLWGGEANGKRGYALTYAIAYIRDFLSQYGIIGETLETTVPWNAIPAVISALEQCALDMHARYKLPGTPYISARITQLYHSGVCIYFTHGYSIQGVEFPLEVPGQIEREMRKVIMAAGGSVSHHHGIGKLRSEFLDQVLSSTGIEVVRSLKKTVDPSNTFGIQNNYLASNGHAPGSSVAKQS